MMPVLDVKNFNYVSSIFEFIFPRRALFQRVWKTRIRFLSLIVHEKNNKVLDQMQIKIQRGALK